MVREEAKVKLEKLIDLFETATLHVSHVDVSQGEKKEFSVWRRALKKLSDGLVERRR